MADPTLDIGSIFGGSLTTGGIVYLFLRAKLASLSTLWARFNDMEKKMANDKLQDQKAAAEVRLADAREYATKAELTRSFEKLEAHVDKRFDSLEQQIKSLPGRGS